MITITRAQIAAAFPISRDPPEGGTLQHLYYPPAHLKFPISRDPPEGGTYCYKDELPCLYAEWFPISRDPPEGGTLRLDCR